MPEYLSPGVYIEEVPGLRAIEGVSTSTAGFVGVAERGTVAGLAAPWTPAVTDPLPIQVPADPAPVLVTSWPDFVRNFGYPLPLPQPTDTKDNGYLGHSVRAFFENGGKRAYVVRVVDKATAKRGTARLSQGVVVHLTRPVPAHEKTYPVSSLRGINKNTVLHVKSGNSAIGQVTVHAYDTQASTITVQAALSVDLKPQSVYLVATAPTATGPVFHARTPGEWSESLTIYITPSDRPFTTLPGAVAVGNMLPVKSTASFYPGAIVEIDDGADRQYHTVTNVLAGNVLMLDGNTTALPATALVRVVEIDITIVDTSNAAPVEVYKSLSWNTHSSLDPIRHYANQINTRSRLVYVQPPSFAGDSGTQESSALTTQPSTPDGFGLTMASGVPHVTVGDDGLPLVAAAGDPAFIGTDLGPGKRTGIQALQDADDVRIIAVPGRTSQAVQEELIIQAERMRYRFAVLDGELLKTSDPGDSVSTILAHRSIYDSSYAGYYTPWVQAEIDGTLQYLPPSGYVTGIYARVDNDRGVWKAPANEVVLGALGLQTYITAGEQDILNPRGVNAIRRFDLRGIRVWGERTLSSDPSVKYINVRRYLIFLEASLDRGTQWVVFEPNSPETWSRVTDAVTAFLMTQWRSGALFGRKPEDAFYVRCDETTMTVDDVQNGRLICDIGVAIVRPAEFVIFRIEQTTGFAKSP